MPVAAAGAKVETSFKRAAKRLLPPLALALSLGFGAGLPATAAPYGNDGFLVAKRAIAAPSGAIGLCGRYDWACARSGAGHRAGPDVLRVANRVNLAVNRQVREIRDTAQYRREEVWALPTSRGGDCEDFALLKKRELIARGIAPERLLIATVLDRKRQSHAVLVLRTDRGDYVLDNLTNRILHWKRTGYTFLRMQNPDAPHAWDAVFAGGILSDSATARVSKR